MIYGEKTKAYAKFTYILLIFLCIFLTACSKEGGKDDSKLPNKDRPPRETILEVDNSSPLPEENSEVRSEDITHLVLHFASNVVNNQKDPYKFEDIYLTFVEYGLSAHYLVGRRGEIYQLVQEDRVAYHAGIGELPDFPSYKNRLNYHSIGIEIMAIGSEEDMDQYLSKEQYNALDKSHIGFTEEQYDSLNALLKNILKRNPLIENNLKHIVGHDNYSKGRKTDPGSLFQWDKLHIKE